MTAPAMKIITGSNLPRSFAVIESSSYREAVRKMKSAFQNPETTLVVWSNAGDLMPDELQDALLNIAAEGREFQEYLELRGLFTLKASLESRISRCFNHFAKGTRLSPDLLQALRQNSEELIQGIHDEMKVTDHHALLRLQPISKTPHYHYDRMDANGIVAFRVLTGDSTEYYHAKDILREKKRLFSIWPNIEVKPDAEIWRIPHGAIAFHSGAIMHSVPSLRTSGALAEGQKRLVEAHIIETKEDFVACQMKQRAPL